jgi:WD40 repeat protein
MRVIEAFTNPGPVDELALSPDGRLLAVAGAGVLAVWSFPDARQMWEVMYPSVAQLAFSPDGTWLAIGRKDEVWAGPAAVPENRFSWRIVERGQAGGQFGGGVAFDPDGRHLLLTQYVPPSEGDYDAQLRGRLDRMTVPHGHRHKGPKIATEFDRLAVSPDGDVFAGITPDECEIRFTNSGGLNARHGFRQMAGRYGSAAGIKPPTARYVSFDPGGEAVVFGWDDELRVADTRSGQVVRRLQPPPGGRFADAAYTGSGRHLGTVSGSGVLRLWDPPTLRLVREYDWGAGPLTRVAFTADGLAGACATPAGRVVAFDLDD